MISFRNRHAAVICPDDKDRRVLGDRLIRLGLVVRAEAAWKPSWAVWQPDVVFFDVDLGAGDLAGSLGGIAGRPMIAVVGAETPGRLDWMLQQRPAAYLLRPIRSSGVYTALVMGFHNAAERREFAARLERLERRARARRVVLAATARMMETQGLSEPAAYRLLRDAAMRQRTTIEEVSARIEAAGARAMMAVKTS
jgi:AmiR/NasT family two-component response regulator